MKIAKKYAEIGLVLFLFILFSSIGGSIQAFLNNPNDLRLMIEVIILLVLNFVPVILLLVDFKRIEPGVLTFVAFGIVFVLFLSRLTRFIFNLKNISPIAQSFFIIIFVLFTIYKSNRKRLKD